MHSDELGKAAQALGKEHGERRADVITYPAVTTEVAARILDGWGKEEDAVLSLCPKPLSGEWADDPTAMHILEQIADKAGKQQDQLHLDDTDDILNMYENTFTDAFWERAIENCRRIMERLE